MTSENRQRARYLVGDFVATNVAWFIFNIIRYYILPKTAFGFASLGTYLESTTVMLGQFVFPLLMLGIYWLSGYYNVVFHKSRLEELNATFLTTLVGALIIFFVVLLNDMSDDLLLDWGLFGVMFGLLFMLVYVVRWRMTRHVIKRLRSGDIYFDTLVVGPGADAVEFSADTDTHRFMGFKIRGVADTSASNGVLAIPAGVDAVELANVASYVKANAIKNIVVLPLSEGREATLMLVNSLFPLECAIYVKPDEFHMLLSLPRTQNVVGDPLIDISRSDMPQSTLNIKRVSDIAVSVLALVLLSPIFAAIAVWIKMDSQGPVFYRQRRIGYHKRPFDIVKFRTMRPDAEASGPALSQGDTDPRITRVGRFLRKYRLDELPQFWNVLRGEMSVVGPRPERAHFIKQIMDRAPYYALLHQLRPGITSWGMVRYGYATNVDEMVERLRYDLLYLQNVSFAVDMKIIFYTVSTVINGKGK